MTWRTRREGTPTRGQGVSSLRKAASRPPPDAEACGHVEGLQHVCRKRGCYSVRAGDAESWFCETHEARTPCPKPEVRPLWFHDLRHKTASLLLMAGAPLQSCSRSCVTATEADGPSRALPGGKDLLPWGDQGTLHGRKMAGPHVSAALRRQPAQKVEADVQTPGSRRFIYVPPEKRS